MDTVDIDRDLLIEALYQLQADLKIMIELLARQPDAVPTRRALVDVGLLHEMLMSSQPSLQRH